MRGLLFCGGVGCAGAQDLKARACGKSTGQDARATGPDGRADGAGFGGFVAGGDGRKVRARALAGVW